MKNTDPVETLLFLLQCTETGAHGTCGVSALPSVDLAKESACASVIIRRPNLEATAARAQTDKLCLAVCLTVLVSSAPRLDLSLCCCKRGTFFYPILDVEIASHADVLRASLRFRTTSAWEANVEVSFWKICPQINAMKWNVHMSTGPEFEGNPNLRVTSALSTTSPLLANLT